MSTPGGRYLLLGGDPARTGHGVPAGLSVHLSAGVADGSEQEAFERGGAEAFLIAPLVRLLDGREGRRLVVGQARVAVTAEGRTDVTVALRAVWSEAGGWHQEPSPEPGRPPEELAAALREPAHPVPDDAEARAVTVAKALAEGSRNEVLKLRDLRYELERRIADLLAHRRSTTLRGVLAEAVELSIAVSRARDQAGEALRERMYLSLWHPGVYDFLDPGRTGEKADTPEPAWLRTHRAAIRHCEAMRTELAEEDERLHGLLASMSTFAVAQESEQQQKFNLLAAVAAAGLGLPALILSFYGAEPFLPLDSVDRAWRALVPIAVTTLVAVVVALRRMPGRPRPRHYAAAVGLVGALVGVLLVAGALAPGS